ncbi:sigma-54-dependent Fis family transcriptional regulator [Exilibacterium tricleocarpae]|uniref:Sigma-54-dependent Fis family transcriptional regulator n=1 Tax=Exilibacterium tricleocarpae TaxID=2591008 RepID=A0A545U3W2_9GAMM|nr:sigma-54 dependent transcriptional regulator [Exilibacterium tricleocarpae]TQV84158.1 sigma-54-dependent Fis family transcriptional regulator [Exilibacterium tricleocarpae]
MWRELKVLVVDDDQQRRHDLRVILAFLGEPAVTAVCDSWPAVVGDLADNSEAYVAVVLGMCHKARPLRERLQDIHRWDEGVPVILVGEHEDLPDDCEIILRRMVIARLHSPPTYNHLLDTLHRAQRYREAQAARQRQQSKRPVHLFRSLVGTSRQIQVVREMMAQVADKDVTVLISGESGTGKEVVARNLHYNSDRRDGPFVPVNCGAIPAELLESELFGHEKGAFTGAISSRAGRFELAEGGTLFLDEIGDMPLNMQVKILRVLQERCFERVGGNRTCAVDVRIIAATHRDLETMIVGNQFREDLYYRLNVFPIEMPSLRERSEDIPVLLHELVARMESENRGSIRFNSTAIMSLCQHEWSGNVRELANLVERMAIMHPFGVIGVQDLPEKYRHVEIKEEEFEDNGQPSVSQTSVANMNDKTLLPEHGIDLKEYLTHLERNLIQQALDDCGGIVARAADRLTIRRTTLVEKMRKYGLQRG